MNIPILRYPFCQGSSLSPNHLQLYYSLFYKPKTSIYREADGQNYKFGSVLKLTSKNHATFYHTAVQDDILTGVRSV